MLSSLCSYASSSAFFTFETSEGDTPRIVSSGNDCPHCAVVLALSCRYYVTFETNEGDTPRIVVSAFGSSWASPKRGSVPVAWAVDPLLSVKFPALMDHFASTATANDSFIAGVAGAG